MAWFEVSHERLAYRGRIDRAPYDAWIRTVEGTAAMDEVASRFRFRLFGRQRAARRQVWRQLSDAARSEPLRATLDSAADLYMGAMSHLAYAAGLPRTQVALRRVVIIPRVMIAARARATVNPRLTRCPGMPEIDEAILAFFLEAVINQLDAGLQRGRPASARPVGAPQQWACVGIDTQYPWVDPYWSGPEWFGHVFLYELPGGGLSRRDRKALDAAMVELQSSIETLPRQRRHELVRHAATA
jgi:hypothetical protein